MTARSITPSETLTIRIKEIACVRHVTVQGRNVPRTELQRVHEESKPDFARCTRDSFDCCWYAEFRRRICRQKFSERPSDVPSEPGAKRKCSDRLVQRRLQRWSRLTASRRRQRQSHFQRNRRIHVQGQRQKRWHRHNHTRRRGHHRIAQNDARSRFPLRRALPAEHATEESRQKIGARIGCSAATGSLIVSP